ncbi:MAG: xanthine dehydrogenase family protein molybdopterin-binding subunit, partial [Chloroflexia bacterium]
VIDLQDGKVVHPASGRALSYRELASEIASEPWSDDAPVTPPGKWTIAGKPALRAEGQGQGRDTVTGRHRYPSDMSRPGMLVGAVLRRPDMKATLASVDTSGAEALPGVIAMREGDFVGVAAPDRRTARRALAEIRAEWNIPSAPEGDQVSAESVFDYLKTHPADPQGYHRWAGPAVFEVGSLKAGRAEAARASGPRGHTLEARYTIPYIAHAPLEPRAALAEWDLEREGDGDGDGDRGSYRLTVWTGSQRPFGIRSELAMAFGIPEEAVRVIVPDTGGAYGGKHTGEAAIEAARLARAVGRPVKVAWSREEEFTWAYLRPAGLIEVSSAVAADGKVTSWEYHNYNSGPEAMRPPYAIENQLVAFHNTLSPLRQGSYRALAATANHFARESHMDELAHLIGMDPLAFRLRNLPADETGERLRAVLLAAAERFGWGSSGATQETRDETGPEQGRGAGIACGTEKGSFVAACAEVEVEEAGQGQTIRVVRIVEAFECGAIVNPEGLASQVEGAVVQALGGALFERIDFAEGKIRTDRFSRYRVPRFGDIPNIEVVLLDRKDLPSAGAGETPIVGPAPAVANAVFDATGVRLRDLPLQLGPAQ